MPWLHATRLVLVLASLSSAPLAHAETDRLVLWDERIRASIAELAAAEAGCRSEDGAAAYHLCLMRQRQSGFAERERRSPLDALVVFFDSQRRLHLGTDLGPRMRLNLTGHPARREVFLQLRLGLQ